MKYCFYRMTTDIGFAPNPYHGICTLAACTPNHMRGNIEPGDVIVGVESNGLRSMRLDESTGGSQRRSIVYYMKVDRILTLDEYFEQPRFQAKKFNRDTAAGQLGDNVYYRDGSGSWRWISGHCHDNASGVVEQDIHGNRVFIGREFFYFGDKAVPLPERFEALIPKYHGIKYYRGRLADFDRYVHAKAKSFDRKGRIGSPISTRRKQACSKPTCDETC